MRKPVRVLLASWSATLAGAPRLLLSIAKSLRQIEEVEIHAALGRPGPIVPYFNSICPTYVFRYPLSIPKTYRLQMYWRPLIKRVWDIGVLWKVSPQVIYHNLGKDINFPKLLIDSGIPVISHIHSLHDADFRRGNEYLHVATKYADFYVACSRFVEERLQTCLGLPSEKVRTIYGGVNLDEIQARNLEDPARQIRARLGLTKEGLLIGGVGRVEFQKGVDIFIKVADQVRRLHPSFDLRFIWLGEHKPGSDLYSRSMLEFVKRRGLGEYFSFLGFKEDVVPYIKALDIFVMCSREETFGLSVVEAMALEKPVVAFPVGGVPETVGLGGGILTDGFSYEELADAISRLIREPELRRELGEIGHQQVRTHFNTSIQKTLLRDLVLKAANGDLAN